MRKTLSASLLLLASMSALAQNESIQDKYFSGQDLPLTAQEKAAIEIGNKWQSGGSTSKPFTAKDGSIQFVQGAGQTQILCAVLQVCDISLEKGEVTNNINVGDPRFSIEPATMGSGSESQTHLLIKPLDVGLDTSLVVTTDKRTYHLRLRSSRKEFMPYVSFIYPEAALAKYEFNRTRKIQAHADSVIPETKEYLGNLDFEYDVIGSTSWKPVRVYNDGVKTIIQMPKTVSQSEAPTLLVIRGSGGLISGPEQVRVNYRLQGDRYIVDSVFDKAELIAGVGSHQQKITLVKRGHR